MPHMANLPWMFSHLFLSFYLILMLSKMFFSTPNIMQDSNKLVMAKKHTWKW